MGDDGEADAAFAEEAEFLHHLFHAFDVEARGGFVAEHELRTGHEGAGDGDALLLTTAEGLGKLLAAVAHADFGDGFVHALLGFLMRNALKLKGKHHVLFGGQRRDEVEALEDESDFLKPQGRQFLFGEAIDLPSGDHHVTLRRINHAAEHGQQGRFPRPRRADDQRQLIRKQLKIRRMQGRNDLIPGLVALGSAP